MKKMLKNCHVKTGDIIKIISGENKGFVGKINCVNLKNFIVFVDGIMPRVKFSKATPNTKAQKIELQVSINISNVMLWDEKTKLASRIGYKTVENKKYRYFKKSGNII
jgi:large subunit ribosomal protein L24